MPTSKELIEMANLEWKNREERKGIHDKVSWTSGWISGYLTRNPQAEREKVLDLLVDWIGEHHECCGKRMVCYSTELSKFLDELREGKDGEQG